MEAPQSVSDYRRISLCNMIYKIASKVLVKRMKKVIHKLVSPYQKAFILGRQISDNLILHHELMGKI